MEAIEVHLILVVWFQARDGNSVLVTWHPYHLGLSVPILVLDQEVVKVALGDCPGKAQGLRGGVGDCQLPQARLHGVRFLLEDWKEMQKNLSYSWGESWDLSAPECHPEKPVWDLM